jgi:hypothetical protein
VAGCLAGIATGPARYLWITDYCGNGVIEVIE